jgi:Cu+-exporting ATPase
MKRTILSLVLLSLLIFAVLAACQRTEPVKATYAVGGMSCDACARNIETSVGSLEGVLSAHVSFKDGKAEVTYDPRTLEPGMVEAALQGMGYTAERQGS